MSLWIIVHKGSQWRQGELFRDVGDGEMEKVNPIKDKRGRIVGEDPTNILIPEDSVKPWAINLDSSAGANVENPFGYDPATGNAYFKDLKKNKIIIH